MNTHVDAAVDVAIDTPPAPPGHYHYVIDKVMLPSTNNEARSYGLDLDMDSYVDNQMGMVIATFAGMGVSSQTMMTKAIDSGSVIMLGDLYSLDLSNGIPATFTLFQGMHPTPPACAGPQDTTCRKHLNGNAAFDIDATAPVDPPLSGSTISMQYDGGPGHLTVQFVIGTSKAARVTLLGAHAKLANISEASVQSAVIAGGISTTDLDMKVIPAMREGFMATVMQDCTMLSSPPACGCAANSTGKTYIGLFDTNSNCDISVDEVRNNSLIVSLLAPDVTLEGQQALSFGFGATFVKGAFIAP